ncbi:ATP-binding cassette domain-containing protein [Sporosarcina sp. HYO08]|uniref:ATP-binding cassette domain-containing protein n=1 Tax=Sporosarcina sp. HYO08 TaxID=1759557 RepID=UPI0007915075|nr:ABC transporter ATP-binding protein [Sporosarcina sp. HYO08]KXH87276.1 ABC transporter [Sporosarcina sp. HYO08]
MTAVELMNVTKKYHKHLALNGLDVNIKKDVMTGVIGRNGVGKTTMMKMIAGFVQETSGTIRVFGESPFNNLTVSANVLFVDDAMQFAQTMSLHDILKECKRFYPNWDHALADRLVQYFGFHLDARHRYLSKGKKNTFNAIIGIAARCALTLFDEPITGMDAGVRKDFYRALLKDYIAHPRTILLSSHHFEEMEDLLEDVLIIQNGKAHFHGSVTELQEMLISLKGNGEILASAAAGKTVVYQQKSGPYTEWLVENTFTAAELDRLKSKRVIATPVSANSAYLALTEQRTGGIDDVFA